VSKISSGAGSACRITRQVDRKSAARFRVVIMTKIVSTCTPAKQGAENVIVKCRIWNQARREPQ